MAIPVVRVPTKAGISNTREAIVPVVRAVISHARVTNPMRAAIVPVAKEAIRAVIVRVAISNAAKVAISVRAVATVSSAVVTVSVLLAIILMPSTA